MSEDTPNLANDDDPKLRELGNQRQREAFAREPRLQEMIEEYWKDLLDAATRESEISYEERCISIAVDAVLIIAAIRNERPSNQFMRLAIQAREGEVAVMMGELQKHPLGKLLGL